MSDNNYGLGGHPAPPVSSAAKFAATADILDGPTPLTATRRPAQKITVYPYNGFASNKPTDNVGDVYVGLAATDLPHKLSPGDFPMVLGGNAGFPLDLSQLYFLVETDGDGIVVEVEG